MMREQLKTEIAECLPGLAADDAPEATLREIVDKLAATGEVELSGNDREVRGPAVTTQALFEKAMLRRSGALSLLILTPTPSTPFCVTEDTAHERTVRLRAEILQGALDRPDLRIFCAFENHREHVWERDRFVYLVRRYPALSAVRMYPDEPVPERLLGASLLFGSGTRLECFSIRFVQFRAGHSHDKAEARLHLGGFVSTAANIAHERARSVIAAAKSDHKRMLRERLRVHGVHLS